MSGERVQPLAPRYQPLVVLLAALAAGIALDRWLAPWGAGAWWLCALAMLGLWWAARGKSLSLAVTTALLLAAAAALGASWHHAYWHLFSVDEIGRFATLDSQPVCFEAVARSLPRRIPAPREPALGAPPRGDRTRLEVQLVRLRDGDFWRPAAGIATVIVEGDLLRIGAGDRLWVVGQIARPAPPENPGEFDFARHHRAGRRLTTVRCDFPECVRVLKAGNPWGFAALLDALRERGQRNVARYVAAEHQPIAKALLLGLRDEVEPDDIDAFMETGSIHLLSISGLHVGILASALFWLLRLGWLPRRLALAGVVLLTVGYTLVSGAEPPAVRAAVLVAVLCCGQWLGRKGVGFNSLAAAAVLVLALNPADLFRVGPQLSFLAVATIGCCYALWKPTDDERAMERLLAEGRSWPRRAALAVGRWAWRLTAVGLAIWLVSLPLTAAHFHLVSLAGGPLNPLLWIPSTVALLAGFAMLALDWFLPPAALLAGWLCSLGLAAVEWAVQWARAAPGSHFWVAGPATWWLAGFYGALASWLAWPGLRPPRRWCAALGALWCAAGLTLPGLSPQEPQLRATFISVGHGLSVLLELPDGRNVLYDAGSLGSPRRAAGAIASCLWSRGITHLDAVLISHADADHFNALPELAERFSIGAIYTTPYMLDSESALAQLVLEHVRARDIPVRPIWAGDRLRVGGSCRVEALHPLKREAYFTDNAASLVLAVEYGGRRLLLTGDLENEGMRDVLAEAPLDCDLVLAPHHGSRFSNPPGFLAWSRPEHVVISGGRGRDLQGALAAFAGSGRQVLHTARRGAVTAVVDSAGLRVECFRTP